MIERVRILLLVIVAGGACTGTLQRPASDGPIAPPSEDLRADRAIDVDGGVSDGPPLAQDGPPPHNPLHDVKYWAYQIQGLATSGAVTALVQSPYDLLVLEPTNTDRNTASFDGKGMVAALHATAGANGKKRLVVAYIDIGEAESWRYYWKSDWKAPTSTETGSPDFMLIPDPDGWADNYPVAFWDPRWKDLIVYATDSMLQRAIDDGYDGIYMDWVEGYSNARVAQDAKSAGLDPAEEMIKLIGEIRAHARKQRPGFLVIPQNAPELAFGRPHYLALVDGIAQEQIYYDGAADTGWNDSSACDKPVPATGTGYSQSFYIGHLRRFLDAGLPVFNVEYACDPGNVTDAYARSLQQGYLPYVSRRPLSRLSGDPPFDHY